MSDNSSHVIAKKPLIQDNILNNIISKRDEYAVTDLNLNSYETIYKNYYECGLSTYKNAKSWCFLSIANVYIIGFLAAICVYKSHIIPSQFNYLVFLIWVIASPFLSRCLILTLSRRFKESLPHRHIAAIQSVHHDDTPFVVRSLNLFFRIQYYLNHDGVVTKENFHGSRIHFFNFEHHKLFTALAFNGNTKPRKHPMMLHNITANTENYIINSRIKNAIIKDGGVFSSLDDAFKEDSLVENNCFCEYVLCEEIVCYLVNISVLNMTIIDDKEYLSQGPRYNWYKEHYFSLFSDN